MTFRYDHNLKPMLKFILRRIGYGFLVLFGVVIVVFILFHVLPGDPANLMGQNMTMEMRERIHHDLGLDQPLPVRLGWYLNDLSVISIYEDTPKNESNYEYQKLFGVGEKAVVLKWPFLQRSYFSRESVNDILLNGIFGTFWLTVAAMLIATIFGVTFGIIAALNQQKFWDHALITLSVVGISTPSFISAIFLGLLLAGFLHSYTGLEFIGSLYVLDSYSGEKRLVLKNLILPAITLGIRPLAIITQMTRSSMLNVMNQDYIMTARAKGVNSIRIILFHALKNALNPVVTAVSGWLASLMAGAFFVEFIFSYKGIGLRTVDAVGERDFPIVMGAILVIAVIFILVNIIVDIIYAILDPRVKLS